MESSDAFEPASRVRHLQRSAPADPHGADLSTGGVLAVLVMTTALTYVLTWATPRVEVASEAARWLVANEAAKLVLWLSILGLCGWWRAGGMVPDRTSARTLAVLASLSAPAVLVVAGGAGFPGGAAFGLTLVVGTFLGSLREEVAFRGFLLYGLTRRLGPAPAILAASALFAIYHVPRYLREERPPAEMAALLIVAFGIGVFLCRVRTESGSVWLPALLHGLWNVLVDVGHWTFPGGELPGVYVLLHTAPFALGIVMALLLAAPGTRRGGAASFPGLRRAAESAGLCGQPAVIGGRPGSGG